MRLAPEAPGVRARHRRAGRPERLAVCLAALAAAAAAAATAQGARAAVWQPSPGHVQAPIWPGTPPDLVPDPTPESGASTHVSRPTMTMYAPKGRNTGVAVVVFPGGGYQVLAMDLEGTEICDWLTSRGVTCVLLKYRVPNSGPTLVDGRRYYPKVQTALQDAQRTLGLVRQHAAQWHVDPHKVGVIGFSAGGHLVAAVSTHFAQRTYRPVDAADALSCRPDFAIAVYPGHLWAHEDESRATRNQADLSLRPDIRVRADTPPTFLAQAENDDVDSVEQSLAYYVALQKAGVPTELHLYAKGGHAFGLRRTDLPIGRWPQLVEQWLRSIRMLGPRQDR
jgi:acetyl esterase/lipase